VRTFCRKKLSANFWAKLHSTSKYDGLKTWLLSTLVISPL
jgi:hypothetical protein